MIRTFEEEYYVFVPSISWKFSKEEWKAFLGKYGGDVSIFRDQRDLISAIKKWRDNGSK